MLKKSIARALIALLLAAGAAHADEASVKKAIETWLNGKVDGVRKTPYLGLYEVHAGGEILYTDEKLNYVFVGNIIDGKSRANLTQERMNKLSAIKFSDLPLDLAIKTVRGDGKNVLATFEDPNCGYCKKLAKELQGMNNITVYTFLIPILGGDSPEKSKAIWCAPDRVKAWSDLMLNGVVPGSGSCDAPIDKLAALGQKLGVRGTPTIFLSSGERIPGFVSAAKLDEMLKKIAVK